MSAHLYGVYGSSGFGREVMPIARSRLHGIGVPSEQLMFVDDNAQKPTLNGQVVRSFAQFLSLPASGRSVCIAIANSSVRERLAADLARHGVLSWSVRAENSILMDEVQIGEGAVICPFVTLTSNVRIGRHFHANIYSYVAHDCVVGDFVTFAPGVKCNGNVVIEDHAYVGTGAVLKQGTPGNPLVVGRGAVVGMGAVVTKNVPAGVTVVGNPAKPISRG